MANLTSAINIQVDSDTKKQATDILNNLGLSMSTAINIFLKHPNDYPRYTNREDLKKALLSDNE